MIGSTAALEIILQAKDEASSVLDGLGGSLGGLGGVAAGVATGGLALAGAALAGIAAGTVLAAKAIYDFSQDADAALNLFAAQTGTAADELGEFRDVAMDVWAAGWGESVEDVTDAMADVHRALGQTGEELETSTRQALILRDVFEYDVAESMAITSSMMANFGVTSEEAFDLLTTGSQMGANRMGDLGDTLHEYSSDFERLGFTAEETLSILNAGLEAGAYNTDVVADGFREMGIRLSEGGDATAAAFDAMGMDFERIRGFIASGDEAWGDYTGDIIGGLLSIDDQLERNVAGAAIFGTKWEDIGGDVFLAAGQARDAITDMAGATDAAGETVSQGLGPALEELKRTVIVSLSPLGDKIGEVIDKAIPYLEDAAKWIGENVPKAIEGLEQKVKEWTPTFKEAFLRARVYVSLFRNKVEPILNWLRDEFGKFSDRILPHLRAAWDYLGAAWDMLGDLYHSKLKPAFVDLMATLNLGEVETGEFGTVMADFASSAMWTYLRTAVAMAAGAIDMLAGAIRGVNMLISTFRNGLRRIREAIDALRDLNLPSWLTPGSATPFELGLRGITDAIKDMPDLSLSLNAGLGGGMGMLAPAMAGRGAGNGTVIHNHFGRDSVRSDADIEEIARRQEEILLHRGVRTFEV